MVCHCEKAEGRRGNLNPNLKSKGSKIRRRRTFGGFHFGFTLSALTFKLLQQPFFAAAFERGILFKDKT